MQSQFCLGVGGQRADVTPGINIKESIKLFFNVNPV